MAKKIVQAIRRTVGGNPNVRMIVTIQKTSEGKVEKVIPTEIKKVMLPPVYRKIRGKNMPVEQYAFEADGKTFERFAQATAYVLRKHKIELTSVSKQPNYVKKALSLKGKKIA